MQNPFKKVRIQLPEKWTQAARRHSVNAASGASVVALTLIFAWIGEAWRDNPLKSRVSAELSKYLFTGTGAALGFVLATYLRKTLSDPSVVVRARGADWDKRRIEKILSERQLMKVELEGKDRIIATLEETGRAKDITIVELRATVDHLDELRGIAAGLPDYVELTTEGFIIHVDDETFDRKWSGVLREHEDGLKAISGEISDEEYQRNVQELREQDLVTT